MLSKYLLKVAAKNYSFDINTLKIEELPKFGYQTRQIHTFRNSGKDYVLKVFYRPIECIRKIESITDFNCYLAENNANVATPLKSVHGGYVVPALDNGENYIITAFEKICGKPWIWNEYDPGKWNDRVFYNWGKTMGNMHRLTKYYKPLNKHDHRNISTGHDSFFDCLKVYPAVYNAAEQLLKEMTALPKDINSFGLIHCDMHPENFYIHGESINVFDFDDSQYGWFTMDIGIALFHALWWGRKDGDGNDLTKTIVENFITGYISSNRIGESWISKIPVFIKYRQICNFIPWFLNPDHKNDMQDEWIYNIENDIIFDRCTLKSLSDIIRKAAVSNYESY